MTCHRHLLSLSVLATLVPMMATMRAPQHGESSTMSLEIRWHTIDNGGGKSTGDAFVLQGTAGQPDAARREWNRALFRLSGGEDVSRVRLLERLARMEEAHGTPTASLRCWASILQIEPDHAEARHRSELLGGISR